MQNEQIDLADQLTEKTSAVTREPEPAHKGDVIPKKPSREVKQGQQVGCILENGGGTTIGAFEGNGWKPDEGRTFWARPIARHFTTAPIPAGVWLTIWPASSAQPFIADMGPAPQPEILDHLVGAYPPSLFDQALRENVAEAPGFQFEQWMAWAAVAAIAIISTGVLVYFYMKKNGMV